MYLLVFQEMTLLAPLLDLVVPVCRSLLALSSPMTQTKVVLESVNETKVA